MRLKMKIITKTLTILMITIILTELMINLTYAKEENKVTINKFDEMWQIEEEFTASTYYITSQVEIKSFKVSLEKADSELPEGIRITDENLKNKDEFEANEKFKICIPWTSLKDYGNFKINIEAKDNNGKIYYDSCIRNYEENRTSILIVKKNFETNEFIEGVEFEILNSNKEVIYSNLKTNMNGQIFINALLPGTYYVREVNTIPDYELNEDTIEVKMGLYETAEAIFNAIKKPSIETDKDDNLNSSEDANESIKDGEPSENENIKDEEASKNEKQKIEDKINKNESSELSISSEINKGKKLPITGM